jgi:hypothetical protein
LWISSWTQGDVSSEAVVRARTRQSVSGCSICGGRTAELGYFEFDRQLVLSDINEETAKTQCDHLIDLLSDEFSIFDAFPTGSIPRKTAIRGVPISTSRGLGVARNSVLEFFIRPE